MNVSNFIIADCIRHGMGSLADLEKDLFEVIQGNSVESQMSLLVDWLENFEDDEYAQPLDCSLFLMELSDLIKYIVYLKRRLEAKIGKGHKLISIGLLPPSSVAFDYVLTYPTINPTIVTRKHAKIHYRP